MTSFTFRSTSFFNKLPKTARFLASAALVVVSLSAVTPNMALAAKTASGPVSQTVDINHADAKTIAVTLKGIGLKKAQAIVAYREKRGDFKSVEQLAEVKGIGPKMLEQNKGRILVK